MTREIYIFLRFYSTYRIPSNLVRPIINGDGSLFEN